MATLEIEVRAGAPGWRELSQWLLATGALRWTAFDLWVVASDEGCDATAYVTEMESPEGLTIGPEHFVRLAPEVLQLIDGVIVGWELRAPTRNSLDVRPVATVALEAIDGAWWRIYARDERRLNALHAQYPGARKLDPDVPMPAVHRDS